MSEPSSDPRAGIARAVDDMSASTRQLVREEIRRAQQEMWQRTKAQIPGVALLATAGLLGTFAVASTFRLSIAAVEKVTGPTAAAALATAGFGAGASIAAVAGWRWLQRAPAPAPVDALKRTGHTVRDSVQAARS